MTANDVEAAWEELQAEDARRAAEGTTDGGMEYRTGKEDEP